MTVSHLEESLRFGEGSVSPHGVGRHPQLPDNDVLVPYEPSQPLAVVRHPAPPMCGRRPPTPMQLDGMLGHLVSLQSPHQAKA